MMLQYLLTEFGDFIELDLVFVLNPTAKRLPCKRLHACQFSSAVIDSFISSVFGAGQS